MIVDGTAVIASGVSWLATDAELKLICSGDVTETNHLWIRDDVSSFVPSPISYQGNVYLVRDRGEVECFNPATGATIWVNSAEIQKQFLYNPLIANGKLYAARRRSSLCSIAKQ